MKFNLYMVSGLRKSGTTLTKTLLDGHPELFVIPPAEFDFFCYSHHHSLVQPRYDNIDDPNALLRRLANQTNDILEHLLHLTDDPALGEKLGKAAGVWFRRPQGLGFAGLWLKKVQSAAGVSDRGPVLEHCAIMATAQNVHRI